MPDDNDNPDHPTGITLDTATVGVRAAGKMRIFVTSSLRTTDPAYAMLGRVTAEWAHLEHFIDKIVWDLAGLDGATGSCITGQIPGYAGKCNAIMALLKRLAIMDAPLKARINKLSGKITGTANERNRFTHDAWFERVEIDVDGHLSQFKSITHKNDEFGYIPITEDALAECVSSIRNRRDDVQELHVYLLNLLKSSRERLQAGNRTTPSDR